MRNKEHLEKLEGAGMPVKVMVGEEFVKYHQDTFKVSQKWVDFVRKK